MTSDYKLDQGFELINFIESVGSVEWRKFQMRYPEVWRNNEFEKDLSSCKPPYSSFRFECEKPEIVGKLKKAIAAYNGGVHWVMCGYERKDLTVNWTIMPKKMKDYEADAAKEKLTASEYVAVHMPEYAQQAFDDLPNLVRYLSLEFNK